MPDSAAPTPPRPEPRIGSYRLVQPLGSGGMSSVFRAVHGESGLEVAVKILPRYLAKNSTLLHRFLREAKSAEALEHPNIVAIYDRGADQGRHYLVLEYVSGGDLHERVRVNGPLDGAEAVGILRAVAEGLQYAAARGVIHRDVKPANFLRTAEGSVKVTDLGLALQVEEEDERVTRDGTTVGTVDYMAPEQARDSRADEHPQRHLLAGLHLLLPPDRHPPVCRRRRGQQAPPARAGAGRPTSAKSGPTSPRPVSRLDPRMMAKAPKARFADYAQLITRARRRLHLHADLDADGDPCLVPLEDEAAVRSIIPDPGRIRPLPSRAPTAPGRPGGLATDRRVAIARRSRGPRPRPDGPPGPRCSARSWTMLARTPPAADPGAPAGAGGPDRAITSSGPPDRPGDVALGVGIRQVIIFAADQVGSTPKSRPRNPRRRQGADARTTTPEENGDRDPRDPPTRPTSRSGEPAARVACLAADSRVIRTGRPPSDGV